MSLVRTKDISIYYEKSSKKKNGPLLYISGSGGDLRNKPNHFDSPLAEYFEVIGYDQRGLGQTSKPEGIYTMQQYADDAADLLDSLGLNRVPVVGVSFGGMVAQEFAIRHPTKVSKLVLCCTSSGGKGGSSYPLHELEGLKSNERLEKSLRINDVRLTDSWIRENPKQWSQLKEMAVSRIQYLPDPIGAKKQLMARKDHDTYDLLAQLDMPTFLAGGKFDGIAPPKNMEFLNNKIYGSKIKFYDGGHLFLVQDKTAFTNIIQWLVE